MPLFCQPEARTFLHVVGRNQGQFRIWAISVFAQLVSNVPELISCVPGSLADEVNALPSIAQLVERRTVGLNRQESLGRWFNSGSKDRLFPDFCDDLSWCSTQSCPSKCNSASVCSLKNYGLSSYRSRQFCPNDWQSHQLYVQDGSFAPWGRKD